MKIFLFSAFIIAELFAISPKNCLQDIKQLFPGIISLSKDAKNKNSTELIQDCEALIPEAKKTLEDCKPDYFDSGYTPDCIQDIKKLDFELSNFTNNISNQTLKPFNIQTNELINLLEETENDCQSIGPFNHSHCIHNIRRFIPKYERLVKEISKDSSPLVRNVENIVPLAEKVFVDCRRDEGQKGHRRCIKEIQRLKPKIERLLKHIVSDISPIVDDVNSVRNDARKIFHNCRRHENEDEHDKCRNNIRYFKPELQKSIRDLHRGIAPLARDVETILPTAHEIFENCRKQNYEEGLHECIEEIRKLVRVSEKLVHDIVTDINPLTEDFERIVPTITRIERECRKRHDLFLW